LAGDYFAHAGVEAAIFSGELAANRLHFEGEMSNRAVSLTQHA